MILVDRKAKMLYASKAPDLSADTVAEVPISILKKLPHELREI